MHRPTLVDGSLHPLLRAGSEIDAKPGVYVIWDGRGKKYYVGSSVGQSRQGNVRRTILRHFQQWTRGRRLSQYVTKFRHNAPMRSLDEQAGGVTYRRENVWLAVYLLPEPGSELRKTLDRARGSAHAARYLEQWIVERLCEASKCEGFHAAVRDDPGVPF